MSSVFSLTVSIQSFGWTVSLSFSFTTYINLHLSFKWHMPHIWFKKCTVNKTDGRCGQILWWVKALCFTWKLVLLAQKFNFILLHNIFLCCHVSVWKFHIYDDKARHYFRDYYINRLPQCAQIAECLCSGKEYDKSTKLFPIIFRKKNRS